MQKLVKIYEGGIVALDNLDFDIDRRCILMVAGPNGAGKTTLLRIISTALLPTSGHASVLGFDVVKQAEKIRERIAFVPQESLPDPYLTAEQFVSWYLVARGMSISDSRKQARYALELLQLDHVRSRKTLALSGGERRRVVVAAAIAANAELLILDEPTAGLDPIGRRAVHDMIRQLGREHGVILSTHLLSEAERVADRVLVIDKGQILALASVEELLRKVAPYEYVIFVEKTSTDLETYLGGADAKFFYEDGGISIYIKGTQGLQHVISKLAELGSRFTIRRVSLDDVFIELLSNRGMKR